MMLPWRLPRAALALILLPVGVTACDDVVAPEFAAPRIIGVAVENDSGSIFRTLRISSSEPAAIHLDYWSAAAPRLRVSRTEPRTEHAVFLPGLRAGEVYDYEIRLTRVGYPRGATHRGQLTTDSLPPDLADLRFKAFGTPTHRLTMLELRGSSFDGYVIVDQDGAVVWYRRGIAESFTRRANGNFVLLDATEGITEVRPDLRVVAHLPVSDSLRMHHDVIRTAANTLLSLPTTRWRSGRRSGAAKPSGSGTRTAAGLERRWSAADFLSPEAGDIAPRSVPADWLHANSLTLGPRENVLMSLAFLNQVLSIGRISARSSGASAAPMPRSFLTKETSFWFQHTAADLSGGRVLLFDNGRDRPDGARYSRALELELDPASGRAGKVWEFRARPEIFAPIVSSARRLPNGNTFIGFGTRPGLLGASGPIAVYEVNAANLVPWRLTVEGDVLLNYRATALPDIDGETVVAVR